MLRSLLLSAQVFRVARIQHPISDSSMKYLANMSFDLPPPADKSISERYLEPELS